MTWLDDSASILAIAESDSSPALLPSTDAGQPADPQEKYAFERELFLLIRGSGELKPSLTDRKFIEFVLSEQGSTAANANLGATRDLSRQPSSSELSRALADLNRYGSNRVGFVKQSLSGRPEIVVPAPQGLSTKEVSSALTRYLKQMAPFATWGMYLEPSAIIFKSNAAIKLIEQYEVDHRGFSSPYKALSAKSL